MGAEGAALARRYEWLVWWRVVSANYAGIFMLAVYFQTAYRIYPDERSYGRILVEALAFGVPFAAFATIVAVFHVRRRLRPAIGWLLEDRQASEVERRRLFALPRWSGWIGTAYWMTGCALLLGHLRFIVRYRSEPALWIKAAIATALLAFVPWSLSYLLVERTLRLLVARTVGADVTQLPPTLSLVGRLVLAWIGTSGLPIAGILIAIVGLSAEQRQNVVPTLYVVCMFGTIAGLTIAVFSGRAISEPVLRVRAGLRAVAGGRTDIELPVSESGELGELQLGFNRMASGLRERERMRELFGQHVGPDVAQRAIDGNFGLGGELHEATAMFVDVIGSTKLPQRWTPDEVVATLNGFFACIVRCVEAEGGFVNKFEGDGALCIFGAPIAQRDHAARALRAAVALRRELRPLRETIDAAIGISSGEVVAGNVGAANRYEYTIIGDPVNEASRLTDEAKSRLGRLLASDATLRCAGAEAQKWTASATIALRGRAEPTIAYEPR